MSEERVSPPRDLDCAVRVPGDKSISHRALIVAALARGRSYVGNLSPAADVRSTVDCLGALGVWVRPFGAERCAVDGDGAGWLRSPADVLDCGNSGTTMRLLAGAVAGSDCVAVLDGDASLQRRPMERVAEPLRAMGAEVTTESGRPPLRVAGRRLLQAREHVLPVASAQVKSAVLLAAVTADGVTRVVEPAPTRDHTERLLRWCGVRVESDDALVSLTPGTVTPFGLRVPGDLSAAAFFLALAAARPAWRVRCAGVGVNPRRSGILDVLMAMGAVVEVEAEAGDGPEPVAAVAVRGAGLRAADISGDLTVRCIDELPVLAVLATQAEGTTHIHDAAELRLKESDRIARLAEGLRAFGAECEEHDDGLSVDGPAELRAARVSASGDHRLAMAFAVAGSLARGGETVIAGAECAAVSFPGFFAELRGAAAGGR
ncbi:MAG: 3-phosphoshikimate 1-carboxyvinyltransferase [Candidatus Dormibacteraeota bacterium]|nr:3-phosphoshikimate 1-carboxyvinyltransferase [Candidatus Dormibacteraeota bacterium]